MYYRGAQFAVIVFDVADTASFEKAKQWVTEVKNKSMTNTLIALVGNKCDLPKETWQIDTEQATKYSQFN